MDGDHRARGLEDPRPVRRQIAELPAHGLLVELPEARKSVNLNDAAIVKMPPIVLTSATA